jgi:hypothetical protein
MTADKLPSTPETDSMAKMYAVINSSRELLYPDGLEEMMP